MSYTDPEKAERQGLKSEMEEAVETTYLLGDPKKEGFSWTFGLYDFTANLQKEVGYELLVTLFAIEHIMRGFAYELTAASIAYVYAEYNLTASQITIYGGVTSLPWAFKPLVGLVSDMFPICGYCKAPYMIIYSVVGTVSFAVVGFTSASSLSVTWLVLAVFLQQLQFSGCDVLCEAAYAQKIQENTKIGPDMLSFVWAGMTGLALLADAISGFVIDWSPHAAFAICAVPAALVIWPVAMNYLSEQKADPNQVAEKRSKFLAQFELCFLSAVVTVAGMLLIACGLLSSDTKVNAMAALASFIAVIVGFGVMLSPPLAMFSVYSILQTSLTLSTSGAAYYFFTDTAEQFPEGPHFSVFFYTSVLGTSASLMSLLGIATFQRYFKDYGYRNLLLATNVGFGILSLFDVMLYSRLNLTLGIPDHVFVLGTSCMENMVYMWQWMPQVIILSYFCPKGMEATMYALLAGCHNIGNTIGSSWGAYLLEILSIEPSGAVNESDKFKNLWIASLIASLLPLITVVALFKLVPDVKQGDPVVDPDASAVAGSLWRKWRRED